MRTMKGMLVTTIDADDESDADDGICILAVYRWITVYRWMAVCRWMAVYRWRSASASTRCHRRYAICCVCCVSDRCQIDVREGMHYAVRVAQVSNTCQICLLYTSPSPRDLSTSRMPSSA